MKQTCTICGEEQDEHDMVSYSTGRKTHWICWKCFKTGQYEVGQSEMRRRHHKYRELKQKGLI